MSLNFKNIINNYHLSLIGTSFFVFFIYIVIESFLFFTHKEFYEGYEMVLSVLMFDLINLSLIIPFIIKKDWTGFVKAALAYILVTLIGFLGFIILFILLPLLLIGITLYFILMASRDIKN